MDQQFATNILSLIFAVASSSLAGAAASAARIDSDRDREVSTGHTVGSIEFQLQLESAATAFGTIEWCVFKVERSFIVPVVGTDPIPSSADVDSQGIQQAFRLNMPGWIMKHGAFAITPEIASVRTIRVSPGKFRKGMIKDGDHIAIALFNRCSGAVNFSVQMRYKEFT